MSRQVPGVAALDDFRSRVRAFARASHRAVAAQVHDSRPPCCMARGFASAQRFSNDADALEQCPGKAMTLRRGAYIPTCRRHAAQWIRLVGPCFAIAVGWAPHRISEGSSEWSIDLTWPARPFRPPAFNSAVGGVWVRLVERSEVLVLADALQSASRLHGDAALRAIAAADLHEFRGRQWEARP
jgi:hypothetical protein